MKSYPNSNWQGQAFARSTPSDDVPVPAPRAPLSLLSVTIPARDEEGCIASTVERLHLKLQLQLIENMLQLKSVGNLVNTQDGLHS